MPLATATTAQLAAFNPLLFLYPFCIISSAVIGGTLLIEPSRTFGAAGPPIFELPAPSPEQTLGEWYGGCDEQLDRVLQVRGGELWLGDARGALAQGVRDDLEALVVGGDDLREVRDGRQRLDVLQVRNL